MLARFNKRLSNTKNVKPLEDREGALSRDKIEVRYFILSDKCVCRTPGRLPYRCRRESCDSRFQEGTIYKNSNFSFIWFEFQVSLGSN